MEKYFYQDGELYRFRIEQDEDLDDPRAEHDQHCRMMLWWNRYSLGDKNDFDTPRDFLEDLVRTNIEEKDLLAFAKSKKASNKMEVIYNKETELYELWGDVTFTWEPGHPVKRLMVAETAPENYLVDDIIENLSYADCWKLLEEKADIVYQDIYVYEHGDITINTSGFHCPWDSGQGGWVVCSKKDVERCGFTTEDWKSTAYELMDSEVKEYRMYLEGEVYGFIVEKFDDGDWETTDSCWGFYSDKWGDDLFCELAAEAGYSDVEMIEELPEAIGE